MSKLHKPCPSCSGTMDYIITTDAQFYQCHECGFESDAVNYHHD